MEIHPLRSGVATSYLVADGGRAMLVDAGEPGLAPKVIAKLRELDAELHLIVLTHFHYDHVGDADAIRAATGARVAIHKSDAEALRRGGKLNLVPTRFTARVLASFINRREQAAVTPDLEFDDTEDLTRYGGFGRTVATPGHTPGSICVVLDDGTVFAGDAVTEKLITHHAQGPMFIEDRAESAASIRAIAEFATTLYVAHNGKVEIRSLKSLAVKVRS